MSDPLTKQKSKPQPSPEQSAPSQQPISPPKNDAVPQTPPNTPVKKQKRAVTMTEAKIKQFQECRQKKMENAQKRREEKEYIAMQKIVEMKNQRENKQMEQNMSKQPSSEPEQTFYDEYDSDSDSSVEIVVTRKPKAAKSKKRKIIYISDSDSDDEPVKQLVKQHETEKKPQTREMTSNRHKNSVPAQNSNQLSNKQPEPIDYSKYFM